MDSLVLTDRSGGQRLELTRVPRPYPNDGVKLPSWKVRLVGQALEAVVNFSEEPWQPESLAGFLSKLAPAWRGWEGEWIWDSAESEMRITATHNGTNTVLLRVSLRSDPLARWSTSADLEFDPGAALEAIGREARSVSEQAMSV
jgi:Family of unknown function (DUF6228)